ncbi:MAG: ABC transporter substrate-binding protein [Thermobacillus sp.]|uniref:ABC transporter substrate-binding protein n=1 Tax=Thermobacillus sp. TaxID=2108467 RepID=UPI000E39F422|nr:extracellular solute-binding protein [Thermobacillus sp.]REK57529.1 MAG: ABC transporter substrate-binding protein [Thermobacillus sp.]
MAKRKNALRLVSLLVAVALILAACGGGKGANNQSTSTNNGSSTGSSTTTGSGSGGTAEQPPKEVSFTIGFATGDPAGKKAIEDVIDAFTAAYPHIKVVNVSDSAASVSYLDWLKTKEAVGEFPDLVEMRDTKVFVEAGKLAELPEDLHSLFAFLPQFEGKYYNAPLAGTAPIGIIYSKKAYADAGITELPKTYEEFLEIQEKLKQSGISPIVVGGKDIWHMGFWVNYFLINEVYSEDPDWNSKRNRGEASFTDENVVQAISDYKELFQKYVDKGWLSTADNQTASFLVTGKAAQLYSGPWMFAQIQEADPNFEFGFYAIPDREGDVNVVGLPTLSGWSFSAEAAKDPDKLEAMKTFIRFFYDPEIYRETLKKNNSIPITAADASYEAGEQMQEVLRLIADPSVTKSLMFNQWYGENAIPPQFRNWFYKHLQELVVNDGDVVTYMKKADEQYDNDLKANQQ